MFLIIITPGFFKALSTMCMVQSWPRSIPWAALADVSLPAARLCWDGQGQREVNMGAMCELSGNMGRIVPCGVLFGLSLLVNRKCCSNWRLDMEWSSVCSALTPLERRGKARQGSCWWPLPISGWCLVSSSHRAGGSAVGCKPGHRAEAAIPSIPPFLWDAVGPGGLQPSPPLLFLLRYPPWSRTQPGLSRRAPLWFGWGCFGTVFCTVHA